jgi:hypothetical protein
VQVLIREHVLLMLSAVVGHMKIHSGLQNGFSVD